MSEGYTYDLRRHGTAPGAYGHEKILRAYLFYTVYLRNLIKISLIHIEIALRTL